MKFDLVSDKNRRIRIFLFFYFCIGVDNRKIKIYDKGAELWTDLSAIDARRENLIETLNSLRSTPYTSKSSMKPDSGVDVRPNYDTSIDEKKNLSS